MSIHISASSFCCMKPGHHSDVGKLCIVSVEVWRATAAISSFRVQLWRNARVMRHLRLTARRPKAVVKPEHALLLVLIQAVWKARKRAINRLFCDQPDLSFEPSRLFTATWQVFQQQQQVMCDLCRTITTMFGPATLTCRLARCPSQTAACLVRLDICSLWCSSS